MPQLKIPRAATKTWCSQNKQTTKKTCYKSLGNPGPLWTLEHQRQQWWEKKVPSGQWCPRGPPETLGGGVVQVWDPGLSLQGKEKGNMNGDYKCDPLHIHSLL